MVNIFEYFLTWRIHRDAGMIIRYFNFLVFTQYLFIFSSWGVGSVGLPFTGDDQTSQTHGNVIVPGIIADIITFIVRNQAQMSEMKLRFVLLFRDFENNFPVCPFRFVLRKVEEVVQNLPNHFFIWNNFYQFHFAAMNVFVVISKLVVEFLCGSFN